jgi:broad specificity phosphatase PhoE
MKTVYFVRHGESEANAGDAIYHGEQTPLTEKGKQQAQFIAERCKKLDAQVLIASTAVRAQQTAEYIAETTGLKTEINGLFTERKPPVELMGRSREEPDARTMEHEWMLSFLQEGKKVASGENYDELKERTIQALEHLKGRGEERILVATHGFFLHMVAALVLLGEKLTAEEFGRMTPAIWIDNTGITRLEYRDQVFARIDGKRHKGWILRAWNDHAHLG